MRRLIAVVALAGALACEGPGPAEHSGPAAVDLSSPLGKKFRKLGGAAKLGAPLSAPILAKDGETVVQSFGPGVIAESDDFGAAFLTTPIHDRWVALGAVAHGSETLQQYLGPPRGDAVDHGGYVSAPFKRGEIFDLGGTVRVVFGKLYARYDQLRPQLGLPTGDSFAIAGGEGQSFASGTLYWSADSGAHFVAGPGAMRWAALGGAGGRLGFPTADTSDVQGPTGPIGESTRFERGVIFSSGAGAFEVEGEILKAYEERFGGAVGPLGFPTSGTQTSPSGTFNNFEGGMLAVNAGALVVSGMLDLYLEHIWGTGDDCYLDVCDGQDVYAYLDVWVNGVLSLSRRLPSSGDCGGDCTLQTTDHLNVPATAGTTVRVRLRGYDSDSFIGGSDDHLGTIDVTFDASNDWGSAMADRRDDGDFHATFALKQIKPVDEDDFRGQFWWSFHNFKTDELTQDQFARTFSDVHPDEKWWLHPFNALFFLLYEGVAANGNCYGMSLESIYAQEGRSPYAEPVWDYFPDTASGIKLDASTHPRAPSLIDQLNIKHGYQLGGDQVLWTVGMFTAGWTHDPTMNFLQSKAAHALGDTPLFSIFDSYLFGAGHTVRPYGWHGGPTDLVDCADTANYDESCWTVDIADPNHPTEGKSKTERTQTVMSIRPVLPNTYEYLDGYSGGMFTGGRLFWTPGWMLNDQPTTPLGSIFQLVNDGFISFLGESGDTRQISDGSGRRLFRQGLSGAPQTWQDLEEDPASRLTNVAPITASDGPGQQAIEVYFGTGRGVRQQHAVAASGSVAPGTPYEWVFASGTLSSRVRIPGTADRADVLDATNVGASGKAISVELPSASAAKAITWTIAGPNRDRWAELRGATLAGGQRLGAWVTNDGQALHFDNNGPPITAQLVVKAEPNTEPVVVGPITIPGGVSEPVDFDTPDTTLTHTTPVWGNDGWMKSPVTVTLTAQTYGRGLAKTEYGLTPPPWTLYAAPFLFAYEGANTLWYRSTDSAGNVEADQSHLFKIDTRAPSATASVDRPSYERIDTFIAHFTATDPVPGSGIESVVATIAGMAVTDGAPVDLLFVPVGTNTLTVVVTDHAGWTATATATFEITASLTSLIRTIELMRDRGDISAGVANALISKVEAALAAQGRGQGYVARNQLNAAIHQLRGGVVDPQVSERAANVLIGDLRYVIDHL